MINQSMIMCFEQAVGSFQYQEALAPLVPGQSMALWRWRTCKLRLWSRYYAVQFLVRTLQCFRESVSNGATRCGWRGRPTAPQQLAAAVARARPLRAHRRRRRRARAAPRCRGAPRRAPGATPQLPTRASSLRCSSTSSSPRSSRSSSRATAATTCTSSSPARSGCTSTTRRRSRPQARAQADGGVTATSVPELASMYGAHVHTASERSTFGELSLISSAPRAATAAAHATTELVRISRAAYQTLLKHSAEKALQSKLGFLRSLPAFAELEKPILQSLSYFFREEKREPGKKLLRQGLPSPHVCLVLSGKVMVHWESPTGFSHVVAELHLGEVVGAFRAPRRHVRSGAVHDGHRRAEVRCAPRGDEDDFISRLPAAALATCQGASAASASSGNGGRRSRRGWSRCYWPRRAAPRRGVARVARPGGVAQDEGGEGGEDARRRRDRGAPLLGGHLEARARLEPAVERDQPSITTSSSPPTTPTPTPPPSTPPPRRHRLARPHLAAPLAAPPPSARRPRRAPRLRAARRRRRHGHRRGRRRGRRPNRRLTSRRRHPAAVVHRVATLPRTTPLRWAPSGGADADAPPSLAPPPLPAGGARAGAGVAAAGGGGHGAVAAPRSSPPPSASAAAVAAALLKGRRARLPLRAALPRSPTALGWDPVGGARTRSPHAPLASAGGRSPRRWWWLTRTVRGEPRATRTPTTRARRRSSRATRSRRRRSARRPSGR